MAKQKKITSIKSSKDETVVVNNITEIANQLAAIKIPPELNERRNRLVKSIGHFAKRYDTVLHKADRLKERAEKLRQKLADTEKQIKAL